ncbi:MAG: hypothetical protein NTY53_27060 [Kiritimatiellaeota bacterium]|nr:hypothetical protein [Kiritimatiellota bacterium]
MKALIIALLTLAPLTCSAARPERTIEDLRELVHTAITAKVHRVVIPPGIYRDTPEIQRR